MATLSHTTSPSQSVRAVAAAATPPHLELEYLHDTLVGSTGFLHCSCGAITEVQVELGWVGPVVDCDACNVDLFLSA